MGRIELSNTAAWSRLFVRPAAVLAAFGMAACASLPPSPYTDDAAPFVLPDHVDDGRVQFREIFCTVLEEGGAELPDTEPCDEALTTLRPEPEGHGDLTALGSPSRPLVAAVVEGVGWDCFSGWLEMTDSIGDHLRSLGFGWIVIPVETLSSSERNAEMIRDAIMAMEPQGERPNLVLIGYSKGAPDILTAIVEYPEIRDRIAAVVGVAGAVGGSPVADKIGQSQLELLRHWPKAECPKGDRGAIESLRRSTRDAWLDEHPLPPEIPYYTLATCPEPERVSKVLKSSYKKLAKIDPRNDGMMLFVDEFIPDSTFLGCVNADHWAVAVPIARTRPKVARRFVDENAYPREGLFEAILRFVDEDLSDRGPVD